jgi:fido (protein-threonine AMPylation protein)
MATPNEKLAVSLAELKKLQSEGRRVFQSRELGRTHRERLLQHGFVREVIKGWLISTSPTALPGDTTPWYASFWEFCALYCRERFGEEWHLSPEQSLLLHAENTVIPGQVVVYSPKGTNNTVQLLFRTSLYDLKQQRKPPADDITVKNGLRLFSAAAALVKVTEVFFQHSPIEAQVALATVKDASEVLGRLLDGGHSGVAGRLAGAFRRVGRSEVADEIVKTMKGAGYAVRETNPFVLEQDVTPIASGIPPIIGRLRVMWETTRDVVSAAFPMPPGLPADRASYMRFVNDIYTSDAYHSLSIEGYSVTPELIDRVRTGAWNPDEDQADRENRDALAARGYWQAFQEVERSVAEIIQGTDAGALVRTAHRQWYRELFQPSVSAGLLRPSALAGYRNHPVFLRGSRHVPPRSEAVADAMNALFDLIEREPEPSVRAVLGHWLFGYIHPYPDGNGRMARFLMNSMLASGGYPWSVVRVEDRVRYLDALESASVEMNVAPFAQFLAERVRWSMEQATLRDG